MTQPPGHYMSEAARTLGLPNRSTEDVLRHMLGHPSKAYTPLALGTAIKRHATTISYAFKWLVDQGWVEVAGTGPRRKYHLTTEGAAAAAMLVESGAPPARVTRLPGDRLNPHPGRWGEIPSEAAQAAGIWNGTAEKILRYAYTLPRGTRITSAQAAVAGECQRSTATHQMNLLADSAWLIRKDRNPATYVLAGRDNPFAEPEVEPSPAQLELAVTTGADLVNRATPVDERPITVDPPSWGFPYRGYQNRHPNPGAADTTNGEDHDMTSITREPIQPEPERNQSAVNGTPNRTREGTTVWFGGSDFEQVVRVAQATGWTPQQVARRGVPLVELVHGLGDDEELVIRNTRTGELERIRFVWAD